MSQTPTQPPLDDEQLGKIAQELAQDDKFPEKVAASLAKDNDFIKQTLTPQLVPKLKSEVAKSLNREKWVLVILSLALATVSLVIMGAVYWLSLWLGGTDPIKTFAVPIISAFCLIILVINVAFNIVVFKVTR